MIIIVQRSDLSRMYTELEAEKVTLGHFGMSIEKTQRAELIVFLDKKHVYVLKSDNWPRDKPMSPTQLQRYIANHTSR